MLTPRALNPVDMRRIWMVLLFKHEVSKNGGVSSLLLFLSFIFFFWVLRCNIARLCGW